MIPDIVRKIFVRNQSYKETGVAQGGIDYDEILAQLNMVKFEIDRIKTTIADEIQVYYKKMMDAIRSKDREGSEINAAEIVLKKRVLKSILAYGNMVELAIRRVQDTRSLESIVKIIGPLRYAMGAMDEYLASVAPQAVTTLSNAIEVTEGVIRKARMITDSIPKASSMGELLPEANELLSSAFVEAEKEVEKLSPKVPESLDPEAIEKKILNYIKQKSGLLNLKKASEDLGIPLEAIKEALYRLEARGVIKVEIPNKQTA